MLAYWFGVGRMTKVMTYLGAILGVVIAGFQVWDVVARHIF